LSGKVKESPRQEFIYVGDDGNVMSIRVGDWKATYLENRAKQLQVWREPLVHLRLPLLFNLRRDPFEKSYENSNTYHDWMIDRAYVLGPMQMVASKFLLTMKEFPPSQTPGDWSLETLERQIKSMTTTNYVLGARALTITAPVQVTFRRGNGQCLHFLFVQFLVLQESHHAKPAYRAASASISLATDNRALRIANGQCSGLATFVARHRAQTNHYQICRSHNDTRLRLLRPAQRTHCRIR
jgi:hypothetical protein